MIRNILFIIFIGFIGYLSFFKPSPGVFNTFTFSAIAPKDCNGTCCNGLIPPLCVEPAFKGFFIENIVFLFIHYVIIALFGYTLIKPFWANTGFCYGLVSSFFIGYIAVIPIIRVLSLFFPYTMIYIPVMVTVLSIIAILEREFIASWPNFRQQQFQLSRYLKHIAWILSFTIFLFGALSILLRQGAFAWVGHGNDQYAFLLEQWRQSPPAHFPLIDKHYDELIFHYFLTSSFQTVPNPVIIWWLTLGLIKTSMLALFISLFKRLNISSFFPILFTTFIFIGTTSLIATKYYMLLDSSNLLFFTVHSGRIIGIAIIALLLVNSLKDNKDTKSIPPLALILIGLGITSTSISNAIWLLLVSAWMILLRISPKEQPATNRTLLSGQLLCYTSTISLLLMYGLPFSKPFYMVRAVAVGISCLLFLWYAFEYIKPTNKPAIHSQAIIILSILLGLIFLGNVWVNNPIRSNTYKHISTLALETPIYLLPPYTGPRAEPGFKGT